jgi:hypothetical protein
MRRLFYIFSLLLLPCLPARAQFDDFEGLISVPCSANPHTLAFTTGSQSTTTQTLTITGASPSATWQANHAYSFGSWILDPAKHWQKVIIAGTSGGSQPTFNDSGNATTDGTAEEMDWGPAIAVNEPMRITGTGTAMDWAFTNNTDLKAGESIVATVNLGTEVVTLTAAASHTVAGPVSGTIVSGREYISQAVSTPFGTGPQQCTTEGHWFFEQGIGAMCANQNAQCNGITGFLAKYGTTCAGAAVEQTLIQSMNFNSIGELSETAYLHDAGGLCATNVHLPSSQTLNGPGALYPTANLGGYISQPVKDLRDLTPPTYNTQGSAEHGVVDALDPRLATAVLQFVQHFNNSYIQMYSSPWMGRHNSDDTDYIGFSNAGWNFHPSVSQSTDADSAYIVLVSNPLASVTKNVNFYGGSLNLPFLYADPVNYFKDPMVSVPTTCADYNDSTHGICSLDSYLAQINGNSLTALNIRYGSSYSTLLSSGTEYGYSSPVSSWYTNGGAPTVICTGTGSSASCTGTLNIGSMGISRRSVEILYTPSGGSPVIVGGDLANGLLYTAGRWKGNIGVCTGLIVTDSNGDLEQLTKTGCPAGTTTNSDPPWPSAAACPGTITTDSNSLTWKCLGPGLTTTSGATTSTVTYATGAVTLNANQTIPNGAVYSAAYVTDGWGLGTGLLDEAGQNSWASTTGAVCPVVPPAYQASRAYTITDEITDPTSGSWQVAMSNFTSAGGVTFSNVASTLTNDGATTGAWMSLGKGVCQTGGDFGAPTMNTNLGTDIEAWIAQMAAQWMLSTTGQYRQIFPDFPDFGPDNTGTRWTPPRQGVLQAANLYLDGIFHQTSMFDPAQEYQSAIKYQFVTRYFQGPIVAFQTIRSTQSPSGNCSVGGTDCFPTQQARGEHWYISASNMLNKLSFNGTQQNAGNVWWESHTGDSPSTNWGLITAKDNLFNGVEDVTATVTCSVPRHLFNCGGESSASWNGSSLFSDVLNPTSGNALWFSAPITPTSGTPIGRLP